MRRIFVLAACLVFASSAALEAHRYRGYGRLFGSGYCRWPVATWLYLDVRNQTSGGTKAERERLWFTAPPAYPEWIRPGEATREHLFRLGCITPQRQVEVMIEVWPVRGKRRGEPLERFTRTFTLLPGQGVWSVTLVVTEYAGDFYLEVIGDPPPRSSEPLRHRCVGFGCR